MIENTKLICANAITDYENKPRPDWVGDHAGQAVLCANMYF